MTKLSLMFFLSQAQELHSNENILLQTLGFDVAIDHPHTHVVKCCQMVKGVCLYLYTWVAAVAHACVVSTAKSELNVNNCFHLSSQGACPDLILHGHQLSAPDHDVSEVM